MKKCIVRKRACVCCMCVQIINNSVYTVYSRNLLLDGCLLIWTLQYTVYIILCVCVLIADILYYCIYSICQSHQDHTIIICLFGMLCLINVYGQIRV